MPAAAVNKRDPSDHLVSSAEVARILNVHDVTVRRHLMARDDFPRPMRLGGNRCSWWHSEIVAFAESRRDAPVGRGRKARS
jgi:predicted DNA-binding transcriptional regulator AlpA